VSGGECFFRKKEKKRFHAFLVLSSKEPYFFPPVCENTVRRMSVRSSISRFPRGNRTSGKKLASSRTVACGSATHIFSVVWRIRNWFMVMSTTLSDLYFLQELVFHSGCFLNEFSIE
jgi:hypothetical protein